jgi:hypothetical protein
MSCFTAVIGSVEAMPGNDARSWGMPMRAGSFTCSALKEGRAAGGPPFRADPVVSPGYFGVMKSQFSPAAITTNTMKWASRNLPLVIVNRTLAERLAGGDAVGEITDVWKSSRR